MQVESPERLRNVAVVGHNDTGKTTLVSSLLYTSGVSTRLNRVEDGNTVTDFDPEEIQRGISIGLSVCFAPWRDHRINLIDCPGYGIFLHETRSGLRVADSALLAVNTVSGFQVTTEKTWDFARSINLPVMIHLTRLDRENADFDRAVAAVQESCGRTALPVQIPIGKEHDFCGIVDLVANKAYRFEHDGNGKGVEEELPAAVRDQAEEWRSKLAEAVAETDDSLMESYFEQGELSQEQLREGLRNAVRACAIFPITISASGHGIGNSALLDSLIDLLPSPADCESFPATDVGGADIEIDNGVDAPAAAIVFKTLSDPFSGKITIFRVVSGTLSSDSTVWNSRAEEMERIGHLVHLQGKQGTAVPKLISGDIGGVAKLKLAHTGDTLTTKEKPIKISWIDPPVSAISFAIEPKSKGDEEKIGESVSKLMEEDTSLQSGRDAQTGEYLLSGTGQLHVEIAVAKLKSRFKVEVILHPPKVPYRETVRKAADGHGRHKKQSGGRGQFAVCRIRLEPLPRGGEFEFVDEIFGGSIPQNYRPAVEKGIRETAALGYLAGFPVVEFKVRLLDGQYHDVDSSEMAFKIAGSLGFKDAMEKAAPTILEPVMQVEINTTEDFMGDIMSDLSQRRGKPQGMESKGSTQIVKAVVPMSEMLSYAPALRSMTQGRSSFTMEFSHYEEVPKSVQEKIIAQAKEKKQAEAV